MNGTCWYSKQDMLNELAAMTGVPLTEDVDENCIVRGRNPPPKRRSDNEDDEFNLRFGGMELAAANSLTPDLSGITEMLRLVNDKPPPKNDLESKTGEPVVHVISKLNPHVQEFIPKSGHSSSSGKISDKCNGTVSGNMKQSDKFSDDSEKLTQEELLKNNVNLEASTLKDKTQKNVAIAALLKLNSFPQSPGTSTPTISCSSSPKPMILIPPEYFESTPPTAPVASKQPNKYSSDPIVQESIKKVNNWFEKPVTTTDFVKDSLKSKVEIEEDAKKLVTSRPLLEPFTYKRKDKGSSSSTSLQTETAQAETAVENEKEKSPPQKNTRQASTTYQPSPLAAELLQKYREDAKKLENFEPDVMDNVQIVQKGKKGQKCVLTFGLNFRGI